MSAGDQNLTRTPLGTPIGHNGRLAVAWCVGLAVLGHFWSTRKFNDDPK